MRGRRDGFTLVEVVVTFVVLALAAAVAVPAFMELAREDDLSVATRRLGEVLRAARDSAVRGGTTVALVVDSVSGLAWIDVPPAPGPPTPLGLPPGVRLEAPEARTRFTFAPSGRAFSTPVVLEGATRSRLVDVDPWTGDVVVRDASGARGSGPSSVPGAATRGGGGPP